MSNREFTNTERKATFSSVRYELGDALTHDNKFSSAFFIPMPFLIIQHILRGEVAIPHDRLDGERKSIDNEVMSFHSEFKHTHVSVLVIVLLSKPYSIGRLALVATVPACAAERVLQGVRESVCVAAKARYLSRRHRAA